MENNEQGTKAITQVPKDIKLHARYTKQPDKWFPWREEHK